MERNHEDYASERHASLRRVVMTEEDFCMALRKFGVPLPADTQVVKVRVPSQEDDRVHLVVASRVFPPLASNPMIVTNLPALSRQKEVSHDPTPIPDAYAADRLESERRVTMTEDEFCDVLRECGFPLPTDTHVCNFRERGCTGAAADAVQFLVASRAFPAPVHAAREFPAVPELDRQQPKPRR